jgi:hypothetical protein
MALAGRPPRRGAAGFRWLAAGIVLTLFVLLIDAALKSSSPALERQVSAGAWLDEVLPAVSSSNAQGQVLSEIWAKGPGQSPAVVAEEVSQVQSQAKSLYQQMSGVRPPPELAGPSGLLLACLLARAEAASSMAKAFSLTLGAAFPGNKTPAVALASFEGTSFATGGSAGTGVGSASLPAPVQQVQQALAQMQVGDQAYQLFVRSLPPDLGVKLPSSVWLSQSSAYEPQNALVFLATLQSSTQTNPVLGVRIYQVSVNPAPVSVKGGTLVLPDVEAITLTVVVADVGNQAAPNLTVTATVSPAGGRSSSARDFVSLVPGQAHSIVGFGPLNPAQGPPVTLTVSVTAPGIPTPLATQTLDLQMPAPTPPSTTAPSTTSTTTTSTSARG